MTEPGGIDDATLQAVIERASKLQSAKWRRSTDAEVVQIASELGIEEGVVRQALKDVKRAKAARHKQRTLLLGRIATGASIATVVLAIFMLSGGEEDVPPPTPTPTVVVLPPAPTPPPAPEPATRRPEPPKPAPQPRVEPPKPPPKVTPPPRPKPTPALLPLEGKPSLKARKLHGVWRLFGYQIAMDGRSVEMPLRHDPSGMHADRETWTFRADGTFTHRHSSSLWFSGKWRLGLVAQVPEPLRPSKKLEIVHLITEEVTTSLMQQRPIEHHLVALTSDGELITFYSGKDLPAMRTLKQGHRFEKVKGTR